jgi:hypothetical protein
VCVPQSATGSRQIVVCAAWHALLACHVCTTIVCGSCIARLSCLHHHCACSTRCQPVTFAPPLCVQHIFSACHICTTIVCAACIASLSCFYHHCVCKAALGAPLASSMGTLYCLLLFSLSLSFFDSSLSDSKSESVL